MISGIYNSAYPIYKTGSRKGKTKSILEKEHSHDLDRMKLKHKGRASAYPSWYEGPQTKMEKKRRKAKKNQIIYLDENGRRIG